MTPIPVAKAEAQAWWHKARKVGEEAYLLARVLPPGSEAAWPNLHVLRVVSKKYPGQMLKLYRTVLDTRPAMHSWPLARAVGKSPLARAKKVELFVRAAGNEDLEHRRDGLRELSRLDARQFVPLLVKTLDGFPRKPDDPYLRHVETSFVHLVMETDDPRAWQALLKAARRQGGAMAAFVKTCWSG